MAGAGEDGEAGIFWEAGIGEREFAEEKERAAGRLDAARVKAIGAEAGAIGFWRIVGRWNQGKFSQAVCGIAQSPPEKFFNANPAARLTLAKPEQEAEPELAAERNANPRAQGLARFFRL
jgi:hypothetical protein